MELIIVTGMSGSGKSVAVNALEDIGFFCIDNIPPQLISTFTDLCVRSNCQKEGGEKFERVALVTDIRGGELFLHLGANILELKNKPQTLRELDVKLLFLDAEDESIINRYKETRRKHPLDDMSPGCLEQAIDKEREILSSVREITDYYINTSDLSTAQLKQQINAIFLKNASDGMIIQVMSFGFKHGTPKEADLMFDVRCLPNPFYVPELRSSTGLQTCVSEYVMQFPEAVGLITRLKDLLDFLIPMYIKEGKSQLVIAFGCTGGKHRSVTFAEQISKHLSKLQTQDNWQANVHISHRDIDK